MRQVRALLLAAGMGTRLKPLTNSWPKCLMPVAGYPLLEHWFCALHKIGIKEVLVNIHSHRSVVEEFLNRNRFKHWVSSVYEAELLGTAGTLAKNSVNFSCQTTLLVHADNWCQCDLNKFIEFHENDRPADTVMTMMTFRTGTPENCGIVELDREGVVQAFHEKINNPPGNLANGAVYMIDRKLVKWLEKNRSNTDFSTQVLPHFVGQIATWENKNIHRDIGTIRSLVAAQNDPQHELCWAEPDNWQIEFEANPVHQLLKSLT